MKEWMKWALLALGTIGMIALATPWVHRRNACEAQGGAFVSSGLGYVCVERIR